MAPTIEKLLIANRGEIAVRIAETAARLGLRTVAVHSDADTGAFHTQCCDEAVRIGPAPAIESYLSVEALLAAAARTGADAVHPGYGFLAENAGFAQAVIDAGLTWVGPGPEAIAVMGSKSRSRSLAVELGVPVLEGSIEPTLAEARRIGFPVLVKAVSGGGGRGMRIVRTEQDFEAACVSAAREAAASFGDGSLMLERYVDRPRHVEIQVFGDTHGNTVHLYERECSIQRRHQKVIEEHPSMALDEDLRAEMGAAAVKLAAGIRYVGAGTVEFLVDAEGRFSFLEMNTRIQVEHPVTELITGVDLVEWQLRIAAGEPLPEVPPRSGAAIEARLYAEDPDRDYAPQTGRLLTWWPWKARSGRVDGGVGTGSEIGVHYDPMLAKVLGHGPTRDAARRNLIRVLEDLVVLGVGTNRDHLLRVLRHPAYAAGELHTHFLEEHAADLGPPEPGERERWALLAAALRELEALQTVRPGVPPGWRNNPWRDPSLHLGGQELRWRRLAGAWRVQVGDDVHEVAAVEDKGPILMLSVDGLTRRLVVAETPEAWHVHACGGAVVVSRDDPWPEPEGADAGGACVAPMPGSVLQVAVGPGDEVAEGQVLAVLEAMKTEHRLLAPRDGVVASVRVEVGEQVDAGAVLVELAEEE